MTLFVNPRQLFLPGPDITLSALAGLWQDTSASSAASANNDPIGQWTDAVGGKEFEQATAGARPLLQTAVPSVLFDGSNDYLSYAGAIAASIGSVILSIRTPATFTAEMAILSSADTGSANNWFEIGITDDGKIYVSSNASGTEHKVVGSTFLAASTAYAILVAFDGTDYYVLVNDTEQNPLVIESIGIFGWFGDVSAADNIVVGGTVTSGGLVRPFKGEVIAIDIYSQDITA